MFNGQCRERAALLLIKSQAHFQAKVARQTLAGSQNGHEGYHCIIDANKVCLLSVVQAHAVTCVVRPMT